MRWVLLVAIGGVLPVGAVYLIGLFRWLAHPDGDEWRLGIDFGVTLLAAAAAFAVDLVKRITHQPEIASESVDHLLAIVGAMFMGIIIAVASVACDLVVAKRKEIWANAGISEPTWKFGWTVSRWCIVACNAAGTIALGVFLMIALFSG